MYFGPFGTWMMRWTNTPGIFVNRLIEVDPGKKRIEFRNTRPRPAAKTAGVEV